MGTTVSSILTKVRTRINETSTTFHSDANIIAYVDDAQKYIAENNLLLAEIATTTLVSTQNNYGLPADFIALERVLYEGEPVDRTSFEEIDGLDIDESDESGDPVAYYVWGEEIFLFPTPGSSQNGNTLKMFYYKKPITIDESTDSLQIGSEFDGAILAYCVYSAYLKDKQFDMAEYHLSECNAKIAYAMSTRSQRAGGKPRMKMSRTLRTRQPLDSYYRK